MGSDIKCPVCGSEQLSASKRGFDIGKAIIGDALTGDPLFSLLAGGIGKDKVVITCLKCGHKFSPGDPLSNNHEVPAAETDKLLADKKDLPQTAYFKCSCGKVSSLETYKPYCPSCGRRLEQSAIVSEEEARDLSKKGGCLGVLLLPLLVIGGILAML